MPEFDFEAEFVALKQAQSKSICLNQGVVRSATVIAQETLFSPSSSGFLFEVSNDGGLNWIAAPINTTVFFVISGQDLRYRVTGPPGTSLKIRDTTGKDTLFRIRYSFAT